MKYQVNYINYVDNPTTKPISLTNFALYKNRVGHRCFSFQSENHKYLDIGVTGYSTCLPGENEIAPYRASFVSFDVYGEDEELPERTVEIYFIPETEEEQEELYVEFFHSSLEWGYVVYFLPHSDLYPEIE